MIKSTRICKDLLPHLVGRWLSRLATKNGVMYHLIGSFYIERHHNDVVQKSGRFQRSRIFPTTLISTRFPDTTFGTQEAL